MGFDETNKMAYGGHCMSWKEKFSSLRWLCPGGENKLEDYDVSCRCVITEVEGQDNAAKPYLKLESFYMTKSLTNKLLLRLRLSGL